MAVDRRVGKVGKEDHRVGINEWVFLRRIISLGDRS